MDFEKVMLLLNAGFSREEIIDMLNADPDGASGSTETGGGVNPSTPPADPKPAEKVKDLSGSDNIADAIADAVASAIKAENDKLEKMIAKFSLTVAGSSGDDKPVSSWENILGELINPPGMDN